MEKIIKDLENYSIDEQGVVRNIVKGTVKSVRPNKQTGYLQVDLWKNNMSHKKYIHRLIAEAFIPNPLNLPQVNHKDKNTFNNDVSNLEWCTCSQNHKHAFANGRDKTYLIMQNQGKKEINATSKYHGVCWDKNKHKYMAFCKHLHKNKFLGRFINEEDAAKAYDNYVIKNNLPKKLNFI